MTDNKTPKVLGVLGGLGPMASVYFYELITKHTFAQKDQDHIDIILNSRATTPDRTAFILGESGENPFDIMAEDAKRLVTYGAQAIAIPCNTAHFFYDKINECIDIPILNMVDATVETAKKSGGKTGILATTGTVKSKTYQRVCEKQAMSFAVPDNEHQKYLMSIIYDCIKCGKPADMEIFNKITNHMREQGCSTLILGCTELSIVKRDEKLDDFFIDSMEVLAKSAIELFGKKYI